MKKAGYDNFQTSMPAPSGEIVLEFTVRDTEDREDYDSRKALQKVIEKVLGNTNWSLINQSISYRLGLLTGRIRGVESEEDLEKLTKSRMKKGRKKVTS